MGSGFRAKTSYLTSPKSLAKDLRLATPNPRFVIRGSLIYFPIDKEVVRLGLQVGHKIWDEESRVYSMGLRREAEFWCWGCRMF